MQAAWFELMREKKLSQNEAFSKMLQLMTDFSERQKISTGELQKALEQQRIPTIPLIPASKFGTSPADQAFDELRELARVIEKYSESQSDAVAGELLEFVCAAMNKRRAHA